MTPSPFRAATLVAAATLALAACSSPRTVAVPQPGPVTAPPVQDDGAAVAGEGAMDARYDTVRAGRYDTGRMWTFDNPPAAYLQETYGFAPDDAWFSRARLGALRFATYCSASFVSPNGLILTNHHCARQSVTQVDTLGEGLVEGGFIAASLADERGVEGLFVEQLVEIVDVSAEVDAAAAGMETLAERANARQEAAEAIEARELEARGGEDAGYRVQVIPFYAGARHSAYVFKRYDDIRLTFAPESQLGFYGGEPDNFTYPRYSLDFALLRAYDAAGEPLEVEHYFPFDAEGADADDLVFVIGNPGSTTRLQSVAELEYRRDVSDRAVLRLYGTRADVYDAFVRQHPDDPATPELQDTFFSLSNARKAYTGRVGGLDDPYIVARRRAAERDFRAALAANAGAQAAYGDVLDAIAENRREARGFADAFGAFVGMNPGSPVASATLSRALFYYLAAVTGNDRLREVAMEADEDAPTALEEALIRARLEDFRFYLGDDDAVTRAALDGQTPAAAAARIRRGSAFATAEGAAAFSGDFQSSDDPALVIARALAPRFMDYQQQAGALSAQLGELQTRLARARFEVFGTDIPPDATFSLRINDGVVQGYPYNGTVAPPHTTFYGLYDRYYSFPGREEWDLPQRWMDRMGALDLKTPINFVTTNDIIGGNSGSPMLSRDLRVVGVAFDGNMESLPGDFIYLGERNRTVGVDSRGMLEALRAVYEAPELVEELTTGRLAMAEQD